ncbi:MAG TPA: PVC-type heme-binding CxxCH protein [Isosphaeraceae bacterium]|nr:PVC-type heme-binding CxxCH protein [Isosphaeraceae bacterium]
MITVGRVTFCAVASWMLVGALHVEAAEFHVNGRSFTLPEGFEIELVAGPPLVNRPIVVDFDEQGRLYVADSSGSNDKVTKQLEEKPHRIVRLEDTDGDGRVDKSTVVADRMMFPEGTMWLDGSLYVSAPPSIWKLTDTDGDGVADQRVEWFQGKTLTGCANDLHGPYPGPDGWIYWCKGAFATQTYERPGRSPFVTRAAHIFRCRPDGTGIEPVMTGGMDNPVDVVFTPGGERIFTTTFFQHPGGGRRDGLIHAIYGGVYGKVHDVIDGHPRTSPDVMPVLTHLGAAAPCGLVRYESDAFGRQYQDNLFAALFNMQKVTRHVLGPDGATFKTLDEDFLVSPDRDFHPTDVQADADGSLIVADTGGWYKLCCPTSQLVKPDVLGAIYRVRRKGAPRVDDPRGLKLAWSNTTAQELTKRLDDDRPAVRRRAIETLARRGDEAVPVLLKVVEAGGSIQARRNAVWAATRIGSAEARDIARSALADADGRVRQAAIHSISLWRDRDAVRSLLDVLQSRTIQMVKGRDLDNQRAAAEALGRIGDKSAVPALLSTVADAGSDHVLQHSLTFALIEIADPSSTAVGLKSPSVATRRAAMVALDQMAGGKLDPERVAADLNSAEPALKETATWIVGRHPEWGSALVVYFRERLTVKNLSVSDRIELEHLLARLSRATPIQELLVERLRDASAPREVRALVLQAMAESNVKVTPNSWVDTLGELLATDDAEIVRQAVATVRALPVPEEGAARISAELKHVAGNETAPANIRLEALAAMPGGLKDVSAQIIAFLNDQLSPERPVTARSAAAEVLSKAKLTTDQLESLADSLKTAGPLEAERLLAAFAQSSDERVGHRLVADLKQSSARSTLRVETLKPLLDRYGDEVRREAEGLYSLLKEDSEKQAARLEKFLAALSRGEIRRGQAVFNSTKAACSSCHAIGYLGGKVGPDLTQIGKIRSDRDLLEAIVFPSSSFVRSFEPMSVATKDGKVHNGVLRKDASDEVVLATSATEEVHIARDDIEEMRPGTVSIMPAGLDQQLTTQELADLVAFLRACR